MPRCRPLYTSGASALAIIYCMCCKAQEIHRPLGLVINKSITFISSTFSFVYPILYQWLQMLSFVDYYILCIESKVESIIPITTHLFDKIDDLVRNAEALPTRVEGALTKFPSYMNHFPIIDWVMCHVISWGPNTTREKDILIDMDSRWESNTTKKTGESFWDGVSMSDEAQFQNETTNKTSFSSLQCFNFESPEYIQYEDALSSPDDEFLHHFESINNLLDVKNESKCCSYKEALEKGTKETTDDKNNILEDMPKKKIIFKENMENELDKLDNPILDLFDPSWHMK